MDQMGKVHKSVSRQKRLLLLFVNMLYISAFTFGGGFVIVTLMEKKFVGQLGWLQEDEMLDIIAISQSSPGAIAVNAAIQVGWKVGGFIGMLVAVVGTILPPMIILTVISFFYKAFAENPYVTLVLKGMQAAVVALIIDVTLDLGKNVASEKKLIYWLVMVLCFVVNFFFQVNVVYIIGGAILLGLVQTLMIKKKQGKEV